jgi:anti-sigma B factor antagonist
METNRPVVVKRIPERLNLRQARAFCREIEPILRSDRPQIVFDCSHVKQIDAAGVEMLLQCLAQVIKNDGDVKLAALSPEIAVILEMTRTERLFEIYDSSSDAVLSFSRFLPSAIKHPAMFVLPGNSQLAPATGATLQPASPETVSLSAEDAAAADAAA